MQEKLSQVVRLLREIDDELDNAICLDGECLGFDEDDTGYQFSFWGIADMIEHYARRVRQ